MGPAVLWSVVHTRRDEVGTLQRLHPPAGYPQGNPFSANGSQATTSVLATSALPFPRRIALPPWPSPTAFPVNGVCYSDNRAFFEPFLPEVPPPASECTLVRLDAADRPFLVREYMPRFKINTLVTPPEGAPLAQCARSAGAVQLFGRLAVLETHTL